MSTTRYDGFIIWGHGLPYIEEIMEDLRKRFEIIVILRKAIDDVRAFVDEIYGLDTYPVDLIREKTDYLLQEKNEAVYILVKNDHVDLWDVDMGIYAKKECRYVAETKVIIREKWNKHPHHHVIHGTDTEQEANHILRIFGGGPLEHYKRNGVFPFHIDPFEYDEVEVDLTTLRGKIATDYWTRFIKDTPHYLYAIGNKIPYKEYFYSQYGYSLIEDHFPLRFDHLIETYEEWVDKYPILVIGDRIVDGGHRSAIMLSKGKTIAKSYKMKEQPKQKPERKRILLVGGSGGVGQSLLDALDHDKYEVVALGSKDLDVTKETDFEKYGNPEVVILLSGILSENGIMDEKMIEVNCKGAVNVLNGFIPLMRPRGFGRIILMSSVFSDINIPYYGVYSATKAFIDKLAVSYGLDNAKYGITVNSIQLGYTGIGMGAIEDPELYEKTRNKSESKRFCKPNEIGQTIEYIIETEYLNATTIKLDGGIR